MTIAIMQPYLFPYIGYWQLIHAVDIFVIYDNIEFTKKGWFNRNNILIHGENTLFTVPIKKDSDFLDVRDRRLSENSEKEIKKIISQIEHSYKKAPYFDEVFPMIKDIFNLKEKNLFSYIYHSVHEICKYLEIDTKIIISSTLDIDHELKAEEKVMAINKTLHADNYINAIGGLELYNRDKFSAEGINLNFLKPDLIEYKQFDNEFIPCLSIIDIMMFNSKDEIQKMLSRYVLI